MTYSRQLRVPGPTPLPEAVVRNLSLPMLDFRGPEFAALADRVVNELKQVFQTEGDMLLLTCSGMGGLESAVANLLSPGDPVVVAVSGMFGDYFAAVATAYGADVTRLEVEWGEPVEPEQLEATLAAHPDTEITFLTHNETSTGVTNPLRELAAVGRERGCLTVVDAISSVSCIPLETDTWGVDVAVSASQKGWMAPPGLSFVSVSDRAWQRQCSARSPRFYFDWATARSYAAKGSTPFTPALSTLYGVSEGLRLLLEEGLDAAFERHRRIADAVAAGLEALGFRLFACDGYRSATVTAAVPPTGTEVTRLRQTLRERYGVVIAGGLGKMAGKLIRIGHLGAVNEGDILHVLWAIEGCLEPQDRPAKGRSLEAAAAVLAKSQGATAAVAIDPRSYTR